MTKTPLTAVELVVLSSAAAGLSAAATAKRVGRSLETVKSQRKSILKKYGAVSMTQAVAIAYDRGTLGDKPVGASFPISKGQIAAFGAKSSAIARARGVTKQTIHDEYLAIASERAEREITSLLDLTWDEAHDLLDDLETLVLHVQIEEARRS